MRFITDVEVGHKMGCARATVWRHAKEIPGYPQAVKLSAKHSRWLESEVDDYIREIVNRARGIVPVIANDSAPSTAAGKDA